MCGIIRSEEGCLVLVVTFDVDPNCLKSTGQEATHKKTTGYHRAPHALDRGLFAVSPFMMRASLTPTSSPESLLNMTLATYSFDLGVISIQWKNERNAN